MSTINQSVIWTGAGSGTTVTLIRKNTFAPDLLNALLAHSNADWLNFWQGIVAVHSSPAPVSAQYPGVNQRARLVFLCADGTSAQLQIVAPKLNIFLSDGITVDVTTIPDIVMAATAGLLSASGSLAVSYQSGILIGPL